MVDLSKVKPLDIDAHLGKVQNRVALVGIELEGGWEKLPQGIQQLDHDGSVFNGRRPAGANYIGELPIGPVLPASVPELLKAYHPHKVNHTCGMHVHMSFNTLWYYQLLMVPEYQKTMLHYLSKWATDNDFKETHHIWQRLRGESRYCQEKFWPDRQANNKRKDHNMDVEGHRYTHVHYCGRQKTIEVRTLPMMERAKLAASAIQRVIDITNACLYVIGPKERKNKGISGKVTLADGMVYEETIIERM